MRKARTACSLASLAGVRLPSPALPSKRTPETAEPWAPPEAPDPGPQLPGVLKRLGAAELELLPGVQGAGGVEAEEPEVGLLVLPAGHLLGGVRYGAGGHYSILRVP